jgi:two-component system phosphate regulon sensor histidine kinase PhoR
MNPKLLFWVPAALRTGHYPGSVAAGGWMFGRLTGLGWRWWP